MNRVESGRSADGIVRRQRIRSFRLQSFLLLDHPWYRRILASCESEEEDEEIAGREKMGSEATWEGSEANCVEGEIVCFHCSL